MLGFSTQLMIATLGSAPLLGSGGDGKNPFIIDSIPAQDTMSGPNTRVGATPEKPFFVQPVREYHLN